MYKIYCWACDGRGYGALVPKDIAERMTDIEKKCTTCISCAGYGYTWWMQDSVSLPEDRKIWDHD